MSDVPNDVFREVLRRVPVDTLFLSRSVCKAWCKIIDDPNFAKLHFNRGLGDDYLILRNSSGGKVFLISLSHIINGPDKKCIEKLWATNVKNLVGRGVPRVSSLPAPSCNGLFLISTCKKNFVWLVWNPFIGEYLEIPQCDEFPIIKLGHLQVPYSGIGYDEANDDYKVVRIVKPHTFIYSLRIKCWRRIDGFPDFDVLMAANGVFAYGALHWVITTMECVTRGWIVALDLSTETYRTIPIPSEITDPSLFSLDLYAFGDDLFLTCSKWHEQYVVWMNKDYGCENTWVKVMSMMRQDFFYVVVRLVAYVKSKRMFIFHTNRNEFILYDVGTKLVRYISLDIRDPFSFQASPASVVRLSTTDDSDEAATSDEATSKKKRKRALADRLQLKTKYMDTLEVDKRLFRQSFE